MARNKLTDLNDHLFQMIEDISDDQLTGDMLKEKLDKAKALASLAQQITNSSKLILDANRLRGNGTIPLKNLETFLPPAEEIK